MWRCQWSLCSLSVVALIVYNVFVNIWLLRPTSCPTQARQLEESMPSQSSSPVASALRLATQECTPCTTFPPNPVQDDPISEMDIRLGRWDARHVYRLFDFVIVGDEYADLSEVRKVCLATQSSIEKLYSLIELADHWSGPISLSIYAAGDELRLVRAFMLYVRECYPRAYNRLAVHMVITSERTPVMDPLPTELARIIMKCLAPKLFVSKLLTFRHRDTSKWRVKSVYPQNHLRNLARRNCQTSHVFLVDVDIVPSKGMAETLDKFIRGANKCNLCAFVIPTYELDEHVQFPMNKSDLVRLSKKGLAIPFHQKVFIYNQFASNFTRWEQSLGKESEDVHVSHTVTNFELLYEPFYVAPDTVPPHDERFLGYGFTRNTQVGMHLSSYWHRIGIPIKMWTPIQAKESTLNRRADPETVVLRAGSTYRHEGGVILPVAEIKWHPNYNDPAFDSDIAVMKLKDSIEFSDVMSAVPLPEDNEHIPYNSKVSVSGWGRTKQGAGSIPKHLMAVEIPYQTSTLCQLSYPTVYTDNMFCAGPYVIGGKGTCQGDSGGAALINGKAFGIVSFGRGCAQPLSPSAFANVASLRQWLREQTSL